MSDTDARAAVDHLLRVLGERLHDAIDHDERKVGVVENLAIVIEEGSEGEEYEVLIRLVGTVNELVV